jgi:signal transduction histidine kinase
MVLLDPDMVERILDNLLANAIRHAPASHDRTSW